MATVVLGIVGGVGGALLAGPAGAWKGAQLGFEIGTLVGGAIDAANARYPTYQVGKLSDLRLSSSSYGTFINQVWGKVRIPGILIWCTDLVQHEQDSGGGGGKKGGGKGGGPKTQTFTYTVSFAMAVCRGNSGTASSACIKRIHCDDVIVYDSRLTNNSVSFRFYPGNETQSADALLVAQYGSDAPAHRGLCHIFVQDMLLTDFGNRIPNISFELDTGEFVVGDIITDVCLQAGLSTSDIDVTAATDIVTGYLITSRMAAKDALQPVLSAYQYDLVDVDGVLRAVKRGGSVVATITQDQTGAYILGDGDTPTAQNRVPKTITQAAELPKYMDIAYLSLQNAYQQGGQFAVRQSVKGQKHETITLNMTLDDTEANNVVYRELALRWIEAVQASTSLLPVYTLLAPADPISLEVLPGDFERYRVVALEVGMPGTIDVSLVADDEDLPTATSGSVAPVSTVNQPIGGALPPSTEFFAWSGREIRDEDGNQPGMYVAATGANGWKGCSIYVSYDGGSNYELVGSATNRAVFGAVNSALSSSYTPDTNGFDNTNTVTVAANPWDDIQSTSETLVMNGSGNYGALMKADTSVSNAADYELLGFASSTALGAGQFTIGDFLRAQRSTLATGHANGDMFVLITTAITRISLPKSTIGNTVLVKCLSPYQGLSDVTAQTVYIATPTAPYATTGDLGGIGNWYSEPVNFNIGGGSTTQTLTKMPKVNGVFQVIVLGVGGGGIFSGTVINNTLLAISGSNTIVVGNETFSIDTTTGVISYVSGGGGTIALEVMYQY